MRLLLQEFYGPCLTLEAFFSTPSHGHFSYDFWFITPILNSNNSNFSNTLSSYLCDQALGTKAELAPEINLVSAYIFSGPLAPARALQIQPWYLQCHGSPSIA